MSEGTYYGLAPQTHGEYTIGLERVAEMLPELRKQHVEHWNETEVLYLDDPLDPDYEMIEYLEREARLVCFTVRSRAGDMVGNSMYLLGISTHIKGALHATEDTFFINKKHRGRGLAGAFIDYIELYLQHLGVMYMGMSDKSPCGGKSLQPLMESKGFRQIAVHYLKFIGSRHVDERPSVVGED